MKKGEFSKALLLAWIVCFIFSISQTTYADTYLVSNLNDTGEGSLRHGVDTAPLEGRTISFVGVGPGVIPLQSPLVIATSNISIDGLSAAGAITLTGEGIQVKGDGKDPIDYSQTQHIRIRGLRFRDAAGNNDYIWVRDNANSVIIEHCSFDLTDNHTGDGMIDVTQGGYDVTMRYNMFLNDDDGSAGPVLVSYGGYHVSNHHNLYFNNYYRTPTWTWRPCESYTDCKDNSAKFRMDARYNIVWKSVYGSWTEDSKGNYAYNLFKYSDYDHRHRAFVNSDNNPNSISSTLSEVFMVGNATIDDCRKENIHEKNSIPNPYTVDGANWHHNHAEFLFALSAEGAVWPDKNGIVAEWQDTKNHAGLIDAFADDATELEARNAVIIPPVTIFDEDWNAPGALIVDRADVDQSGTVTSIDAMLTLRKSKALNLADTNWVKSATTGDVNCDNNINVLDANLIVRRSVRLDMQGSRWCA